MGFRNLGAEKLTDVYVRLTKYYLGKNINDWDLSSASGIDGKVEKCI